jgi:hypothetical protein
LVTPILRRSLARAQESSLRSGTLSTPRIEQFGPHSLECPVRPASAPAVRRRSR